MKKLHVKNKKKTIITWIIGIIVFIAAIVCIFPFYWMILNSLKNPDLINSGSASIFTSDLTWDSYKAVFAYGDGLLWRAYFNSFLIAALSTLGTLLTSSMAAFAFAKIRFRGSKPIFGLFIATLMIPGQVTMLPLFMMFAKVGWTNSFIPLILPGVLINTYGVFMLRSFIVSIPDELLEAADVDGCSWFRKYRKIILPLIKPALVTLGLFTFIGSWNNYMGHLIYLSDPSLTTIPLFIAGLKETHMTGAVWGQIMAASTLSVIPLAIVYLSCQKYFVQGIATTGIK
ncbi:MAG: carbohydrate ABC transporter permease [Christensenella sp.]|nr:MAG: carbohydrate ABC transporter permease [Christensenella sp.]